MSIKIFVKRKAGAGRAYAYQMLPSFKTLVTLKTFFNFTPDNCVRCEAAFSDITRFFAGHCPMFGANIQACLVGKRVDEKAKINFKIYDVTVRQTDNR